MKRSFLYLALGAMALTTACTSESVLEDAVKQNNAIGFENVVNKSSRVDDITTGNLKHFNVFGYYTTPANTKVAVPVFQDVAVYRQGDGTWEYATDTTTVAVPERYWVPNAHYYFYAYSCGNLAKLKNNFGTFSMDMTDDLEPSDRVLKINNYRCDNTHQHDLVFASNTGSTPENAFAGILGLESGNGLVGLQFKHLLSKVQAQFTSNFPEDYELIVSDVSIQNIRNIGSYNPNAQNGWQSVDRTEGDFPFVYLLNTEDPNISPVSTKNGMDVAKTQSAYVIPYQYNGKENDESSWVYIKFYITVKNKGQIVFSKQLTGKFNPNWVAGYTYTYNVEVSGSAANLEVITFTTVTKDDQVVDNWMTEIGENPVINVDKK